MMVMDYMDKAGHNANLLEVGQHLPLLVSVRILLITIIFSHVLFFIYRPKWANLRALRIAAFHAMLH